MTVNCNSCYAKPAMGPTTSKSPQMGYNSGIVAAYIDGEPVAIMKLSNRNWNWNLKRGMRNLIKEKIKRVRGSKLQEERRRRGHDSLFHTPVRLCAPDHDGNTEITSVKLA
ncbi:hypothetical protein F2Q69_00054814 [Brassica cretica]|uniref:Uncharacterized protein n=1 Tax=Brassica cretica TaxID=69181 RepID=A0A8S9MY88_BRACR|nr:hypothetical protein F2Q69_00054814 [Brassica cretica]